MDRSELDEENPNVSKVYSFMRESEDDDEQGFMGANPFASIPTGKVAKPSGSPGSVSVTNARKAPMGGPRSADAQLQRQPSPTPTDKPKYPGTFVGQVADAGKQGVNKRVAWKGNGPDAAWNYGRRNVMKANDPWVWDGTTWIKSGAFDAKFPRRNEGVSRTWSMLAETFLRKVT